MSAAAGRSASGPGNGAVRDELRELIREVIRDQLGVVTTAGAVETVSLASDADLAAFVARVLDADAAEREALRTGRKRFRLASTSTRAGSLAPTSPLERVNGAIDPARVASGGGASGGGAGGGGAGGAGGPATGGGAVRRVERGAVTERMVRDAVRAGERLVLGRAAVLTPLAADRARTAGVQIEKEH